MSMFWTEKARGNANEKHFEAVFGQKENSQRITPAIYNMTEREQCCTVWCLLGSGHRGESLFIVQIEAAGPSCVIYSVMPRPLNYLMDPMDPPHFISDVKMFP